jgi:hypothetical protein
MNELTNLEVSGAFMNATDIQATIGAVLASGVLGGVELERLLKASRHLDDCVSELAELIKGSTL